MINWSLWNALELVLLCLLSLLFRLFFSVFGFASPLTLGLSLCSSLSLFIDLYISLYLSIPLSIFLSLSLSPTLSLRIVLYLSLSVSLCLSLCLSVSVCLSLFLSLACYRIRHRAFQNSTAPFSRSLPWDFPRVLESICLKGPDLLFTWLRSVCSWESSMHTMPIFDFRAVECGHCVEGEGDCSIFFLWV